jgi:hypothetical protein
MTSPLIAILFGSFIVEPSATAKSSECSDPSSDHFYFPEGVLGEKTPKFDADRFARNWYSKHLRSMTEPSLSCRRGPDEVYRFLWLRTWGAPIAIRVERSRATTTLSAVMLDGAGGYEPGKVARRVQRKLAAGEWKRISEQLVAADFWRMPSHMRGGGLDGAQWILEARLQDRYHVVDRHSPQEGAFRVLCALLVQLAGLWPSGNGKRDGAY